MAATAPALHLYDYTHGMRRLSLWRESDAAGQVVMVAVVAVPVTLQAPGEAPEVEWWDVAEFRAPAGALTLHPVHRANGERVPDLWQLTLGELRCPLFAMEAEAIAAYRGLILATGEDAE